MGNIKIVVVKLGVIVNIENSLLKGIGSHLRTDFLLIRFNTKNDNYSL